MSRIRIKSNPYKKEIGYEYFDKGKSRFEEIDYNNNPNSKLISENYKNILLSLNVKKVVEAIWDTYYNKDENIQIVFCGTDKEFEVLKFACQDDKYENKIVIKKSDLRLRNEQEINDEIRSIAKNLGIDVKVDPDNIYNTINNTVESFKEEQQTLKERIAEMDKKLFVINSSNDSSINMLLEAIEKQKKMKIEYLQRNKPDVAKVAKDYVKKHVIDKNSLEKKYDSIKNEVEKEIKENNKLISVEDNIDLGEKKSIFNSIVSNTKKMALKGIDAVKTGTQVVAITDKKFMEEVGNMLVASISSISEDIKNYNIIALRDREVLLKSNIEETIKQKFNANDYFKSAEIFSDLEYTDEVNYNAEDPKNQKFSSFRVIHFLPGLPDLNAIRSEWETNINKYVVKNYNLCIQSCDSAFTLWEEEMINMLKDKIVQIDPSLKEKAEEINTIYTEQSKLNERISLVNGEIDKVNLLIDYN